MNASEQLSDSPGLREMWASGAFQSLLDQGRVGLLLVAPDLRILDANEAWCHMTGYELEQLKRLAISDITHPDDLPLSRDFLRQSRRGDGPRQVEKRYLHANGEAFWARARTQAVYDEAGRLRHALVMIVDISEDKRRESARLEAIHQLEMIADNVPGYISYVDRDLRYRFANHAYERRYRLSREQIIGRRVSDILTPEAWENARPRFERALAGESLSFEGRFRDPDGYALVQLVPRRAAEGGEVEGIFILVTDITELKQAEERLREANAVLHSAVEHREQLAAIVEASQDAILRLAMDGTIQFWSKGAERLYGYRAEEIVGCNADALVPGADARVRESIHEALARGESLSFPDTVRLHKDGHEIEVSISLFPVRDAEGRIAGCASVHHDIRELKRLQEQLRHAQRLETAGELAGGIAHDFNNILTVVQGNANSLALELKDNPAAEKCAAIDRAVQRASRLIRQLLTFSRKQRIEKQLFDPSAPLEELAAMLRRSLPRGVELRTRLDSSWLISEDPMQLEQIVLNLSLNAAHAMPGGGELLIESDDVEVEDDLKLCDWGRLCYCPDSAAPGPYVRLRVSDGGSGMAREVLERIFDPFFTTKPKGEGTGLGLAVVYGMVRQGGGIVRVETRPGEGSRFEVYFPRASAEETEAAGTPATRRAEGVTILMVEDNTDILALTRHILEADGYRVLCEQNPVAALDKDYGEEVDFILSDVMMPGMNGPEFVARWLERHPGTPYLYVSGYADEAALTWPIAARRLLPKPFKAADLLGRIREILETREAENKG